jgi:hypothetical protein
MGKNGMSGSAAVTRDGIAGFLIGIGLGTLLSLILHPPDSFCEGAGVAARAPGEIEDKVQVA